MNKTNNFKKKTEIKAVVICNQISLERKKAMVCYRLTQVRCQHLSEGEDVE